MAFDVYDYRTVNRNVLVEPEIRARLYHMKPGQVVWLAFSPERVTWIAA